MGEERKIFAGQDVPAVIFGILRIFYS